MLEIFSASSKPAGFWQTRHFEVLQLHDSAGNNESAGFSKRIKIYHVKKFHAKTKPTQPRVYRRLYVCYMRVDGLAQLVILLYELKTRQIKQ